MAGGLSWDNIVVIIGSIGGIAALITALFGSAIFGPMVTNYLYPKYTPIMTTLLLDRQYEYCAVWQHGQEYRINISTDGMPIDIWICNESTWNKYKSDIKENCSKNCTECSSSFHSDRIYAFSSPFRPPTDDRYYVVLKNYENRSAIVNITMEAQQQCNV